MKSYNANTASMRMALAVVAMIPRSEFKRRVAVLGDMLEARPGEPEIARGARAND